MIPVLQAGRATMTQTGDTDTRETTTTTAMMGPQEIIIQGAVRGMMNTPVRATVATILATKTTMGGDQIQAGAPALEIVMQGINPCHGNVLRVLRIEEEARALQGNANVE